MYNFILCYEYCTFISIRHVEVYVIAIIAFTICTHSQPTTHTQVNEAIIERKLNKLSCSKAKFYKFEIAFEPINLTHQMHCEESLPRARKIPNCASKLNASAGEYNYTLKLILDLHCFDFGCTDSLV